MTTPEHSRGSPARKGAVVVALRYYGRQMARLWRFTVPAMLLSALGNTCIFYVAPLIVAQLVGRFAGYGLSLATMAEPLPRGWWTTSDVAIFLGIAPSTIRAYVARGQMRPADSGPHAATIRG